MASRRSPVRGVATADPQGRIRLGADIPNELSWIPSEDDWNDKCRWLLIEPGRVRVLPAADEEVGEGNPNEGGASGPFGPPPKSFSGADLVADQSAGGLLRVQWSGGRFSVTITREARLLADMPGPGEVVVVLARGPQLELMTPAVWQELVGEAQRVESEADAGLE